MIKNMKIGFIGSGNMATAMIKGILSSKLVEKSDLYISDINNEQLSCFADLNTTTDNSFVVENSDYIFLTVKPQFYDDVLSNITNAAGKIFITVAPGITTSYVRGKLGEEVKVIRTMPNTPALIGEGITAVFYPESLSSSEREFSGRILSSFSTPFEMDEALLDPAVSVMGSSPAYAYMFINAIAKSGKRQGMDYETALKMAAGTVIGAAKMLLSSADSPEILIEKVCSKGGTTIEAVNFLNERDFDIIIDTAMQKCTNRALELKK